MAKTKTTNTAKRQVFLDALKIIKSHDRKDGTDFLGLADQLTGLLNNAPRSGRNAEEWAICSALWASDIPDGTFGVDEIDEHCKGGELFMVAYYLGWLHAMSERRSAE